MKASKLPPAVRKLFSQSVRPGHGRQPHVRGRMNKMETRYADHLRGPGEMVREIRFEEVKFTLADRCWYTPDFYLVMADGSVEIHEVKGYWQEDARVKWKAAAEKFWEYKWVAVTWKNKAWVYEVYRE